MRVGLGFLCLSYVMGGAILAAPMAAESIAGQKAGQAERIVSLSLASDEILHELLKEKGELSRLVAVSTMADDSKYSFLSEYFKANSSYLPQVPARIEQVLRLSPDLVVAAGFNHPKLLFHLKKKGVRALVLDSFSELEDIKKHIVVLGQVTAAGAQAQRLIQRMDREITRRQHLRSRTSSITMMLYSVSGYYMGSDTLFADLLRQSGFTNMVKEKGWPKLSLEAVTKLDPDYLVASCEQKERTKVIAMLRSDRAHQHKKAVVAGQLICIENRALYSTSFHIIEALKALKTGYTRYADQKTP